MSGRDVYADSTGLIVSCPSCGQKNRLHYNQLGRQARCPKCQHALNLPDAPLALDTTAAFDALIGQSSLPVFVDFWAEWCGPCHMVAPEVAKVAGKLAGQVIVAKVDTEALPDVSARFGIRSIPMMALFIAGREAGRTVGARPAQDLLTFINETTASAAVRP
jgi:thioredoxin 2